MIWATCCAGLWQPVHRWPHSAGPPLAQCWNASSCGLEATPWPGAKAADICLESLRFSNTHPSQPYRQPGRGAWDGKIPLTGTRAEEAPLNCLKTNPTHPTPHGDTLPGISRSLKSLLTFPPWFALLVPKDLDDPHGTTPVW